MRDGWRLGWQWYSDEDILKLLRTIKLKLAERSGIQMTSRAVNVKDATHYNWRQRFVGMARLQLAGLLGLEKENARLKKIVAALQLDKLFLKESLSHLEPRADDRVALLGRHPHAPEARDIGPADLISDRPSRQLDAMTGGFRARRRPATGDD